MKKLFVLFVFLFASVFAKSQERNSDFEKFEQGHRTLMTTAYEQKNAGDCNKYFNELLAKYNTLSEKDKTTYKDAITGAYYDLACTYSITGNKKLAIDNLERSQYYDYAHLQEDSDMDPLRKDPRFIKYMVVAKAKNPDHKTILQMAPKYGGTAKSDLPKFTYQSKNDEHLVALRKAYNLDSVAGDGKDVLQIINLMRWVHYLIPHNGSKGNPSVKNAMDFITVCKRDGKSLNCRGLAILLNEVYLAEGFKSRYVTCMPKDTADNDCHVITMVYCTSLGKWLWMDPTFMGYVMDQNGTLQSIEEVRDRLINNKPFIINPDANHNRDEAQSKEYYIENYMAKNLYKLQCAVSSEYNYETREEGKQIAYIELIPGSNPPDKEVIKNTHGNISSTTYFTTDPKAFWQAPAAEDLSADCVTAIGKFQKFYNNHQHDSLSNMYSDFWGDHKKTMWTKEKIDETMNKYGEIISYKFMGIEPEDGVALFKVVCTKSTHCMGISLDKDNKISTSRFKTSSPYINGLLAKN